MGTTFPDAFPTPYPGQPAGVGTFVPGHPYASASPFNGHATLTDDLVSYWALDEESGTRYDSVGSNDLTDNNTVGFASVTGPPNFPAGKAASFVAANTEYFSKASNATLQAGNTDRTFAFWAKRSDNNVNAGLFAKGTVTQADAEYRAYWDDAGGAIIWQWATNGAGGLAQVTTAGAITSDAWHLVVLWHDATANKIYIQVDDDTAAEAAASGGNTGSADFRLGHEYFGTYLMNGQIANFGLWSRVLTAQERTDLYNSGAGLFYGD